MIQFLAFHQLLSLFLGQIQFCLKRPWSGIRYCLLIKRFAIKKRVNFAYIICNNYGYGCAEVLNLKLFFFFLKKGNVCVEKLIDHLKSIYEIKKSVKVFCLGNVANAGKHVYLETLSPTSPG